MGTRKIKRRNKKVKGGEETEDQKKAREAAEKAAKKIEAEAAKKIEAEAAKKIEAEELTAEIVKKIDGERKETLTDGVVSVVPVTDGAVTEGVLPGTVSGTVSETVSETDGAVLGTEAAAAAGTEAAAAAAGAETGAETGVKTGVKTGEPTNEQVEKEEKVELKRSLDNALKEIPFVGEIIDKNPIAGHAITLFKSVFPSYSDKLTTFLSDEKNKEAINGIISEMSKSEFANNPTKQAEIFSSKFGKELDLNETDLQKFTPNDIMMNVNKMKDEIKTTLDKKLASSPTLKDTDFSGGPEITHDGNITTVVFKIYGKGTGGKRKSKKSKKSKKIKSKKIKSKTVKRRTHKKKSKK